MRPAAPTGSSARRSAAALAPAAAQPRERALHPRRRRRRHHQRDDHLGAARTDRSAPASRPTTRPPATSTAPSSPHGATFALRRHRRPDRRRRVSVDLRLTGGGLAATAGRHSAAAPLTVTAADLAALSPLVGRPLPPLHDVTLSTALPRPRRAAPAGRRRHRRPADGPARASSTAASPSGPGTFTAAAAHRRPAARHRRALGSLSRCCAALPRSTCGSSAGPASPPPPDPRRAPAPPTCSSPLPARPRRLRRRPGVRLPALPRARRERPRCPSAPAQVAPPRPPPHERPGRLAGDLALRRAGRPSLRGALDQHQPRPRRARAARPRRARHRRPRPQPPPPRRPRPPASSPTATAARRSCATATPTCSSPPPPASARRRPTRAVASPCRAAERHAAPRPGQQSRPGGATAHATLHVDAAARRPRCTSPSSAGAAVRRRARAGRPARPIAPARSISTPTSPAPAPPRRPRRHPDRPCRPRSGRRPDRQRVAASASPPARCARPTCRSTPAATASAAPPPGRRHRRAGRNSAPGARHQQARARRGAARVNLGDETLDLHLRPQLRLGAASSVPVRVRGTLAGRRWRSTRARSHPAGSARPRRRRRRPTPAARPSVARDGNPGAPAAPPPPAAPLKPADLLRGLLR